MPTESAAVVSAAQRRFIEVARRAVLVTIMPDGRPRPIPICFSLDPAGPVLYTPLDDKPKRSSDPLALARVRDIEADSRVTVLVDRWDEDWTRLAWLRAEGLATIMAPGTPDDPHWREAVIAALRVRYPQYAAHKLETRPLIRVEFERVTSWGLTSSVDRR